MRYWLDSKSVSYSLGDGALTKFVAKSFGWVYSGRYKEQDGVDVHEDVRIDPENNRAHKTTTITRKFVKYMDFVRVTPYTDNLIFKLIEILSNIISFIRKIAIRLLPWAMIVLIVLGVLSGDDGGEYFGAIAFVILGIYLGLLVLPSILLGVLARFLRKFFDIDNKVRENLKLNGYKTNWETW